MCPRTCALGLSSSLLSENKKKTTKVCEIGDRESFFGALFILWIHGKNSHIRTTCKLGGHDLLIWKEKITNVWVFFFFFFFVFVFWLRFGKRRVGLFFDFVFYLFFYLFFGLFNKKSIFGLFFFTKKK